MEDYRVSSNRVGDIPPSKSGWGGDIDLVNYSNDSSTLPVQRNKGGLDSLDLNEYHGDIDLMNN